MSSPKMEAGLWASPGHPRVSPGPGMLQPSVGIYLMNTFPCYLQDLAQILFFFLAMLWGTWDPSSPVQGPNLRPLWWKRGFQILSFSLSLHRSFTKEEIMFTLFEAGTPSPNLGPGT